MKVVSQNECAISDIVSALTRGEIIVYPTETCYGLGCDATNQAAVDAVYHIKGRREEKPLIVLVKDIEMAKRYAEWNDAAERISRDYWPGAVTIGILAREGAALPRGVAAEDGTIALRVSPHPFVRSLFSAWDRPLVSTSANLSGGENIYDPKDVVHIFGAREDQPDILVDAGELLRVPPTTVVRAVGNRVEVVRQGEIVV